MADPNPAADPGSPAPSSPKPRKKKRWLLLKIAGVLVVLLIILVLLIPTIASTGFVRSIVLGKVNENLNGKVEIADWSVGWTGGLEAKGIRVFDDTGAQIAQLDHVSTQLPLASTLLGGFKNIALGKVVVDGLSFDAKVDPSSQLNFAKLAKPSAAGAASPSSSATTSATNAGSSKIPNVSADISISNSHGTFEQPSKPTLFLTQLDGGIKIPDINQPITDQFQIGAKVGDGSEGKITVDGTASVIKNGQIAIDTANVHQVLTIKDVDLSGALPFVPATVGIDKIQGFANATTSLDVANGKSAVLDVAFTGTNIVASGSALKGDTLKVANLGATVPHLTADFPDGLAAWQSAHIKVGADPSNKPILVQFDQGSISATADIVAQAILNLIDRQKPGYAGEVSLVEKLDLAKLANQFRNSLSIPQNVKIDSGEQDQTLNVTITPQNAVVAAATSIINVKGEQGGKSITLNPVHLAMNVTDQGAFRGNLPDLHAIKLQLNSGFATANFQGDTLSQLSGTLAGQLQKLQSELSQFIDFKGYQLAGDFSVSINNEGDLTAANSTSKATVIAALTNLRVGDQINQPWIQAALSADMHHGADATVQSLDNIVLRLQTNNPTSPTIDVYATGNADLSQGIKAQFTLQKTNVDFAKTQAEFGKFIPADLVLARGTLGLTATAYYDGNTKTVTFSDLAAAIDHATIQKTIANAQRVNLLSDYALRFDASAIVGMGDSPKVQLPRLTLSDSTGMVNVQKSGDGDFIVTESKDHAIGGNGKLAIAVDLAQVNRITTALAQTQVTATTSAGNVRSGKLSGTFALSPVDATHTALAGDFSFDNLVLTTANGVTDPQSATLTLRAWAAADASTLNADNISFKSKFATAQITGANVQLAKPGAPEGTAISPLDMLQSAKFAINVPDLPALMTFVNAFAPPTPGAPVASADPTAAPAPPPPPLQFTSGSLAVNADVSHNANGLALNVSDITGNNIAFKRGDSAYQAKRIKLQLAAAVDTGDGKTLMEQIKKVTVSTLTGNLGIATLSMPAPIVVTDLASASPAINGGIKLDGHLTDITTLLATLQNAKPSAYPYSGDFSVTQNFTSQAGTVKLSGGVQVAKFQVMQNNAPAFTEDLLSINNDVSLSNAFNSVAINNLLINMQSSGALKITLQNGTVDDLAKQRNMNLHASLQYDLAKLWPIVHPMLLKPGQDDQYKDLKISGQYTKALSVTGSYPAGVPFTSAIKQITADGGFAVGSFDYNGLNVQNLDIPVHVANGQPVTIDGTKPAGQNTSPPAIANSGQLDLSNITIDLTQDPMCVSMPANKAILANATINPLFAQSFLGKLINNPLFIGAKEATGIIDVMILKCDRLPAGALAMQHSPQNDGRIDVKFSVTQMKIGLDENNALGLATKQLGFEGHIKDATVSVANGTETQNIVFEAGTYRIGFKGNVDLPTTQFAPMTVTLPAARIVRALFGADAARNVPDEADFPVTGSASHPKIGFDAKKLLADAAIKSLLGGSPANQNPPQNGGGDNGNNAQPPPDNNDPLGNLLNSLGKKKKNK